MLFIKLRPADRALAPQSRRSYQNVSTRDKSPSIHLHLSLSPLLTIKSHRDRRQVTDTAGCLDLETAGAGRSSLVCFLALQQFVIGWMGSFAYFTFFCLLLLSLKVGEVEQRSRSWWCSPCRVMLVAQTGPRLLIEAPFPSNLCSPLYSPFVAYHRRLGFTTCIATATE
ncbi:hypothetical protein HDV57DRAFT_299267 [Trichoderma longibrachiatum]